MAGHWRDAEACLQAPKDLLALDKHEAPDVHSLCQWACRLPRVSARRYSYMNTWITLRELAVLTTVILLLVMMKVVVVVMAMMVEVRVMMGGKGSPLLYI